MHLPEPAHASRRFALQKKLLIFSGVGGGEGKETKQGAYSPDDSGAHFSACQLITILSNISQKLKLRIVTLFFFGSIPVTRTEDNPFMCCRRSGFLLVVVRPVNLVRLPTTKSGLAT